jgi:SRSO17 transposase
VENAQVGVFLAYAASGGSRALIDRELYLPQKWAEDRERRRRAGIGDDVPFAAKPELARQMIERAMTAGVPFYWVAGDEVYGGNPKLRAWLEDQQIGYVLAVACDEMITTAAGTRRADKLAALVPAVAWQRLSCADGSKGPRIYDWALIGTASSDHRLLVRRSLHRNAKGELELAFFWCYSPRPVTLPELVAVAGARWAVEDCFAEAKNETGLDHYQVRLYRAWYRHITLSMLAHAFLAVSARATRPAPPEAPPASENADGEPAEKGVPRPADRSSPRREHMPRRRS